MCPNIFGRLIAYLTIVYQVADSCEEDIIREPVQRTVEDFKYIDLKIYIYNHTNIKIPTNPSYYLHTLKSIWQSVIIFGLIVFGGYKNGGNYVFKTITRQRKRHD